jgi:hypothetical protein
VTVKIDRKQELKLLAAFDGASVSRVMGIAAEKGAKAAAKAVKSRAPIGTSDRLSQYYRRMGLGHGTLRSSVKAAKIQARGSRMIQGYVVGPIGSKAFTRGWVELGTRRQGANPWLERMAGAALRVAQHAAEDVLELYAKRRH